MSNPEASFPQLAAAAPAEVRPRRGRRPGPGDRLAQRPRGGGARATTGSRKAWNDGFFRGGVGPARTSDLQVEYWTGKEIGARPPVEYLSEGRKVVNYNDEYLYYVLGAAADLRLSDRPADLRAVDPARAARHHAGPRAVRAQILGGRFAVWCDLADAQTQEQVARGHPDAAAGDRPRSCGIRGSRR